MQNKKVTIDNNMRLNKKNYKYVTNVAIVVLFIFTGQSWINSKSAKKTAYQYTQEVQNQK